MGVKTVEVNDGILTITFDGTITKPLPFPLPGIEKSIENKCYGVIMDVSNVAFINSMGISVLIDNYKLLYQNKVPAVLCTSSSQVLKVLRLSRTDTFIPVVKNFFIAKKMINAMSMGNLKPRREHILVMQKGNNLRGELRKALKTAKQDKNYEISTALTIETAWHFVESSQINMIIIDITFPNDRIQEFIEKVRTNKISSGIPIFIATDQKNLYNASYHTRNGADDIMHLPFNPYSTPTNLRTGLSLFAFWRTISDSMRPFERVPEYVSLVSG